MLKRMLVGSRRLGGPSGVQQKAKRLLSSADAARDGRDWKTAAKLYRAYLELVQNDSAIWTQLGHALKESGSLVQAEAAYRTGLAFAPQDAELHLQLGHLLKVEGRFEEAKRAYLHSNALDPTLGAEAEIAWRGDHFRQPPVRPSQQPDQLEQPVAQLHESSSSHRLGDEARDRGAHAEAAKHYKAFLDAHPEQAGIWVQYGHMLRNLDRADPAEAAYRTAIEIDAADADAPFQLGFLQWQLGRTEEAYENFRRSLANGVEAHTVQGMLQAGFEVPFDLIPASNEAEGRLFIEITDLITVISRSTTISGIQRVQVSLVRHVVDNDIDADVVFWQDGLLWSVQPKLVRDTVALFERSTDLYERAEVIARMVKETRPVRPRPADQFMVTGAFWIERDPTKNHAMIKRTGARLGAYIYDFIPLTTPEFVPRSAVNEFGHWAAELMLQLDFALTISDFVGREFVRLRQGAGLPPILVQTVPLAHELTPSQTEAGDSWSELPAELDGKEFVLCVGSIAAHKNHMMVLQCWRVLLDMGIEPPMLVFAGRLGFGVQDLREQLNTSDNVGGRVLIAEGLSDLAITTLYQHCLFTIFPSFTEGWGLPVGEALAHGKVCFASRMASIPEVGGSFVIQIDPYNARGTAEQIAAMLKDRRLLAAKEMEIRTKFRVRSWADFGALFTQALQKAASVESRDLAVLASTQLLQIQSPHRRWVHGPMLPAFETTARRILGRTVLLEGWHPAESWGCWMNGGHATLSIPTDLPPGTMLRVIVQCSSVGWQRSNRLTVRADGSEGFQTSVPSKGSKFLVPVEAPVSDRGSIELRFDVEGALQATHGETRVLGIGVRRLLFHELDTPAERLVAGAPLRPTTLVDRIGRSATPNGRAAMIEEARRTSILRRGWLTPEAWGTWMGGDLAELALRLDAAPGSMVSVVLRLRSRASAGASIVLTPHDEGRATTVVLPASRDADVMTRVSGRVSPDGTFRITLRSRPAWARIGLAEVFWLQLGGEEVSHSTLLTSMMFGAEQPGDDSDLLARDISFVVAGHMAGTYSLAAVNRRMVLALDDAMPGRVQLLQVEGQPMQEMTGKLGPAGPRLNKLAFDGKSGDGPRVMICQHWPVIPPSEPSDLALAYVFWEESVVPRAVIQTLNQHFQGVLSPARSVTKALIDSGLSIPIRLVGYAPQLAPFLTLGQARAKTEEARSQDRPFTFLHVSSCFPRKGVDLLIAAYAKAFTREAPVKLIIKTFPNAHNTVADQLAALRAGTTELAPIELMNTDISENALLALYRSADCMVLPTRGEGFNMPAAEALAAGLPLIVTGAGGHIDFIELEEVRLLDYRFTHSQTHIRSAGSVWVEPDVDDLCAALQSMVHGTSSSSARTFGAGMAQIGDSKAWAARIKDVAVELLASPRADRSRVAWVSTWMVRCGIAEYSRQLLENYAGAEGDVTVLCDRRTQPMDLAGSALQVRRAWTVNDVTAVEPLAAAIEDINPATVVIQHHHVLLPWAGIPLLLDDSRVRSRSVVITLHNTQQILDETPAVQKQLFASLATIDRIVVHGVADLNFLKQHGLSTNTVLIPQGVTPTSMPAGQIRVLSRADTITIGTYGFFLPPKGIEQLITAFASIRKVYPNALLRLVNAEYPDPVSRNLITRCRMLATDLGVDDAIQWHTEFLDNQQSLALLNGCDLLVLPYQHTRESSSAAVRTALAARVPVVVTPLPIFEELEGAVLRLNESDVDSMVNGVIWLLEQPEIRSGLVQAADRWRDDNSWALVGERFRGMVNGLALSDET